MTAETDRITIVWDQYSYDLVTDDGTVLAAGIATRQDAEDRRRELADGFLARYGSTASAPTARNATRRATRPA